jgi:hypothetical protein
MRLDLMKIDQLDARYPAIDNRRALASLAICFNLIGKRPAGGG